MKRFLIGLLLSAFGLLFLLSIADSLLKEGVSTLRSTSSASPTAAIQPNRVVNSQMSATNTEVTTVIGRSQVSFILGMSRGMTTSKTRNISLLMRTAEAFEDQRNVKIISSSLLIRDPHGTIDGLHCVFVPRDTSPEKTEKEKD